MLYWSLNYGVFFLQHLNLCACTKKFRYTIGENVNLDLFLFAIFRNQREMAEIFWKRCDRLVLDALTAAYILREMKWHCERQRTLWRKPLRSRRRNSRYDRLWSACRGCTSASKKSQVMKENQEQAQECMCQPLGFWCRWTLLHLAMNVRVF